MTKAGKKWIMQKVSESPKPSFFDSEPEFWLRAFCDEVEKRAREICKDHVGFMTENGTACSSSRGQAINELKRELLGDGPKGGEGNDN